MIFELEPRRTYIISPLLSSAIGRNVGLGNFGPLLCVVIDLLCGISAHISETRLVEILEYFGPVFGAVIR